MKRCMTGNQIFDATRALLSVSSGRGHHTRFRRCWRYGAALDAEILSLQSARDKISNVLAGGTTSRSCRRTPRVSRLVQFGATLSWGSPLSLVPQPAKFVPREVERQK